MNGRTTGMAAGGWDCERGEYICWDGARICVPRMAASVRNLDETKTIPRNGIMYGADKKKLRIAVSGTELSRDARIVFGGPGNVRTMVFPKTVRTVR